MGASSSDANIPVPDVVNPRQVTFALLLVLFLSGTCLHLIAKSTELPSPEEMRGDLARWFPDSKPSTVQEDTVLPGYYALKIIGGAREVYLFADHSYSFLIHTDIGTMYDEGRWSLQRSVVEFANTFSLDPRRKTGLVTSLPAAILFPGGKPQVILLSANFWNTTQADRQKGVLDLNELAANGAFVHERNLTADEATALKQKLDEEHGRHSFDALWSKFYLSAAKGQKLSDGSFLLTATDTFNHGCADITVNGVKLRARRIEINRDMNVIKLSGAAEVVGGKLPEAPELTIFLEGKQIAPAPRL